VFTLSFWGRDGVITGSTSIFTFVVEEEVWFLTFSTRIVSGGSTFVTGFVTRLTTGVTWLAESVVRGIVEVGWTVFVTVSVV
jgi:hypothetical protein